MNDPMRVMREANEIYKKLEETLERGVALQELRRAELKIAFMSEDDKRIEEARQACVDTYTANLDELVSKYKGWMAIKKKMTW